MVKIQVGMFILDWVGLLEVTMDVHEGRSGDKSPGDMKKISGVGTIMTLTSRASSHKTLRKGYHRQILSLPVNPVKTQPRSTVLTIAAVVIHQDNLLEQVWRCAFHG